jgi:hypothetical protein
MSYPYEESDLDQKMPAVDMEAADALPADEGAQQAATTGDSSGSLGSQHHTAPRQAAWRIVGKNAWNERWLPWALFHRSRTRIELPAVTVGSLALTASNRATKIRCRFVTRSFTTI